MYKNAFRRPCNTSCTACSLDKILIRFLSLTVAAFLQHSLSTSFIFIPIRPCYLSAFVYLFFSMGAGVLSVPSARGVTGKHAVTVATREANSEKSSTGSQSGPDLGNA